MSRIEKIIEEHKGRIPLAINEKGDYFQVIMFQSGKWKHFKTLYRTIERANREIQKLMSGSPSTFFILSENMMKGIVEQKSGIELIAEERKEQIEKHKCTVEYDVSHNRDNQIIEAANKLLWEDANYTPPKGWDGDLWFKMITKPHKEKLIIAGALIAAEIDRLQTIIENPN